MERSFPAKHFQILLKSNRRRRMGIIRGITQAVIEKAKHEVKDYLVKFMEEEKEKEKAKEKEQENASSGSPEVKKQETQIHNETVTAEEEDEDDGEEILPLIEAEFIKITYKSKGKDFVIPAKLSEILMMLPLDEFACCVKLLIYAYEQKKNFGYLGNTLRKKIGLEAISPEKFDRIIENLAAYGLIQIEQVSDNQKTFVQYIPFDEEAMVKVEPSKPEAKQKKKPEKKPEKKSAKIEDVPAPEDEKVTEPAQEKFNDIPGRRVEGMEDEDLYKSYRTYVSLEIDKAKMRVGRSNFDRIYMEAVKYIDKKYGFKVLSDSEKFKEHLTSYYISAFDIKSFEEWKKNKI